ncbi:tetratricopeptide repeat protein [Vibrio astriarenae]
MIKRILIVGLLAATQAITQVSVAQELSQYSATRVMRANELSQDEKLNEAIVLLESIDSSRDYDKAFIARMLGVFYWQDGQSDNAIKQISYAVDSGLLKDDQAWSTEKMLADLLLSNQDYKQALKHYYPLLESAPDSAAKQDVYLRIAQSHYQNQDWKPTLTALTELHKLQKTDVSTLSLRLGAELQLERWKSAIPTLEHLIDLEPKEVKWWRQLAGLQLRVKDEKGALATLALAKHQRLDLTQKELHLLAQLYAKRGVPEKAARLIAQLEGANTDVKLLREQASYWQQAKEWDKSVHIWLAAAKYEPDYHWNAAQILLQQQRYQQTLRTLDKVPGRAEQVALAKTRAYYKLNNLEDAIIQAKKADSIKVTNQSQSWIKYLEQLRRAHS